MNARANDVTESINFLNQKLITEDILRYLCHKSSFDDKFKVCHQTGAGMQIYFIKICLHCFEKGACAAALTVYFENSGFS